MQGYRLTTKQNSYILNANARLNFKVGAVRSGKSFVDIAHVIPLQLILLSEEPGLNLILGVSKETIERNILQPMRELYTEEMVGTINNRNVAIVCGVPVYCLGAEKVTQVAKIQGMSVKYCYGDEIVKWNPEVFTMLLSRLDKPYSRFDGACNPEGPNHWLKRFIDNEELDAYVQHYKIFDNDFLSEDFINNLCKEYEGTVYYKRYIEGEWALAEGLIYPMYEDAIVDSLPAGHAEKYVVSIDYGTMNAFAAILWSKRGGVWYAEREFYYSGRDTGIQKTDAEYSDALEVWVADIWEDLKQNPKYTAFGAMVDPIQCIVDPSAASFITELKRKDWCKVRHADNAVLDGIRETAVCLKTGKIKILSSLKSWKKEAGGYTWDNSSGEEKPVKMDDHAMDATRYFVKTMRILRG